MIIDCHIHVMPRSGESQAEVVARVVRAMDRLGIAKACVSLGDRLVQQPTARDLREQNRWVAEVVDRAPQRFWGFVYVSPRHPEVSLELIDEYAAEGGFKGLKLWVCATADHPHNDLLCRRAAALGLPVLQHTFQKATGCLPGESIPAHLITLAQRHPDVNFIMAHSGGNWEAGLREVREVANIYPDTCGFDPEAGYTEMAVEVVGAERILYGSDATGRSFASQLGKVTGACISDNERRLILSENLLRLLPHDD